MKYHVPTGFGFSSKASGFYPFGDATDLAGEVGVGDVVWLIQATASNHKPKGRFFYFVNQGFLVILYLFNILKSNRIGVSLSADHVA